MCFIPVIVSRSLYPIPPATFLDPIPHQPRFSTPYSYRDARRIHKVRAEQARPVGRGERGQVLQHLHVTQRALQLRWIGEEREGKEGMRSESTKKEERDREREKDGSD